MPDVIATPNELREEEDNTTTPSLATPPPAKLAAQRPAKEAKENSMLEVEAIPPLSSQLLSSPLCFKSPIASRAKVASPIPTIQFDPMSIYDKAPHHVAVVITPIIEGIHKPSMLRNLQINDFTCLDFEDLRAQIYDSRVKGWEETRGLQGGNKTIHRPWHVFIGNHKSTHPVEVLDSEDWLGILGTLRRKLYQGEKRWPFELVVIATFDTVDRNSTPPPAAKKGKARPNTVKLISLLSDSVDSQQSSDQEDDEEADIPVAAPKKTRDSSTNRQLASKAIRDTADDKKEVIRKRIFALHHCIDERCSNLRGCCFKLRSRKTHHKINILEQGQWALSVLNEIEGITLETPPLDWIAKFEEGFHETEMKKSGTRRAEPKNEAIQAAPPLSNTPEVHYHYAPPANPTPPPMQPAIQPVPYAQPQFGAPYGYYPPGFSPFNQHPQSRKRPHFDQGSRSVPLAPPAPSSPILAPNDAPDLMIAFKEFVLLGEMPLAKKEALKGALDTITDEFIELEQLKDKAVIERLIASGMKQGIADLISKSVSIFKLDYKGKRDASEGLLALGQHQKPQNSLLDSMDLRADLKRMIAEEFAYYQPRYSDNSD